MILFSEGFTASVGDTFLDVSGNGSEYAGSLTVSDKQFKRWAKLAGIEGNVRVRTNTFESKVHDYVDDEELAIPFGFEPRKSLSESEEVSIGYDSSGWTVIVRTALVVNRLRSLSTSNLKSSYADEISTILKSALTQIAVAEKLSIERMGIYKAGKIEGGELLLSTKIILSVWPFLLAANPEWLPLIPPVFLGSNALLNTLATGLRSISPRARHLTYNRTLPARFATTLPEALLPPLEIERPVLAIAYLEVMSALGRKLIHS